MSIFQRIYDIIKSEVGHMRSQKGKPGFDHTSQESDRQRQDWDDSHSSESYTPKDSKLAQYYANLEIPYGSDLDTVHKAWKKQLSKYHPDLYSKDIEKQKVAHDLTQQLNMAYQELKKYLKGQST